MKFDLISDIHLDVMNDLEVTEFVESILPNKPSDVLVFAGDFGYYNQQNILFIKELKKTYKSIVYVYGNNDLKIPLFNNIEGFWDVKERVYFFEKEIEELEGVYRLGKEVIEVEGLKFVGSDVFYDFIHMKNKYSLSDFDILHEWKEMKLDQKHLGWIDHPIKWAKSELECLNENIKKADIIVTHGPPNYFDVKEDDSFGFFMFDADGLKNDIKDKIWCYGHRHKRFIGKKHGCLFYNASFKGEAESKIMTIEK